jgi:hypothetical protein
MDIKALMVCAAMAAVAAGLVGCFAVMRRMTLAADAFSHVALPGIGLALVFRLNPLIGALVACNSQFGGTRSRRPLLAVCVYDDDRAQFQCYRPLVMLVL